MKFEVHGANILLLVYSYDLGGTIRDRIIPIHYNFLKLMA